MELKKISRIIIIILAIGLLWTKPVKTYVENKEQKALNKLNKKLNK